MVVARSRLGDYVVSYVLTTRRFTGDHSRSHRFPHPNEEVLTSVSSTNTKKHMKTNKTQSAGSSAFLRKASVAVGLMALGATLSAQAGQGPQPAICTRACWGARAPQCSISQMSALTRAIIHHTGNASEYSTNYETSKAKARGNQSYVMDSLGYCDADYHFWIDGSGNIFEGRAGSMSNLPRGSHDGCNSNSFGYALFGYFHPPYNQAFTSAMRNSLEAVIAWRMPSAWSATAGNSAYCSVSIGSMEGHYRVKATACPGDVVIPQIPAMRTGVTNRKNPPPVSSVIVDNSSAGFSVTGSWAAGSSSTDKYGADYRYHSTAPVSEPAQWLANIAAGTKNVAAWWPQGSNRSTTAAYHVTHSGGTTVATVNQQANGGKWNSLGNYSFAGGNVTVKLSCWTATGYIVVADAIKWQ